MIPFELHSPDTGNPLKADGPHALRDGETGARWPVIDGIPYLRINRELPSVLDGLRAAKEGIVAKCVVPSRRQSPSQMVAAGSATVLAERPAMPRYE